MYNLNCWSVVVLLAIPGPPSDIRGVRLTNRKHPVGTALARLAGIWGDRDDVVIVVVNDVHKICADQAGILFSGFSGSGFQFQGSSS